MLKAKDKISTGLREFSEQSSSIPCLNYLSRDINKLEKIFWFLGIVTMFTMGFVVVHQNLTEWQSNPTKLITEANTYPIQSIQFPTVTICPDFSQDRFGFVRNLFNAFKFQCNDSQGCQDTEELRNLLNSISGDEAIMDLVAKNVIALFQKLMTIAFFDQQTLGISYDLDKYMLYIWSESGLIDPVFYLNIVKYFENVGNFSKLDALIMDKLTGRCNNYAILKLLNYNSSLTANGQVLTINPNTKHMYVQSLKTAAALSMQFPGGFGTVLTNFLSSYSGWQVLHDSYYVWMNNDPSNDGQFKFVPQFFDDILSMMVGKERFGIGPYDISAILSPVKKYNKYSTYQYQFTHTAWYQAREFNVTNDADQTDTQRYPFFYNNTLGRKLGPHLNVVMEVMYHNMLRAKALTWQRVLNYPEIYGNLLKTIKFPLNNLSKLFHPTWKDYRGEENGDSYMAYQRKYYLIYLEQPDDQYHASHNGPRNDNLEALNLRSKYQQQNMMTLCQGPGGKRQCHDQFKPVLTDRGICYAFNALDHSSLFINNTYTQTFSRIFEPKNDGSIINNEGSGKAFKMFLILDSFQSKITGAKQGTFRVSINQMHDFVNVRDQEIQVETGTHTKITLKASQYSTTQAFKDLSLDVRQCRYANENPNPDSLFQFYTKQTCIFECRLSYSSKMCGCTPWNYPQYGNDKITEICDGVQSYCFSNIMDESEDAMNCTCLPDCEEVKFTTKESKYRVDYNRECQISASQNDININQIVGEKLRHMEGEEYLFWQQIFTNNKYYTQTLIMENVYMNVKSPVVVDKCLFLLQNDFALLTIEIEGPQITRLQRDVSVSFINKLSDLGGTIGLFTGISLLSIVEVGYWLYKLGYQHFGRSNKVKALHK